MRTCRVVLLAASLISTPVVAGAQDFGVMESAETINVGNFKIRANPMLLFGRNGGDEDWGLGLMFGYGFTRSFDLEGGFAFYDGVTFFGGNAEFWILKENPIDFSVIAGFHGRAGDATDDYAGIDLTFLFSGHATRNLEPFIGLDLAFEGIGERGNFTTVHLVPGIEYRVNDSLDLLAEGGIALRDTGRHYISGGIAIYIR